MDETPTNDSTIARLVGDVFDAAPAPERGRLVEQLLRPLGLLSLAAVAGGVFSKVRLRSNWQDLGAQSESLQNVSAAHVVALVDHAQQVSVEAVDGLVQLLGTSPGLSSTAAATVLVTMLARRARARQQRRTGAAPH